MKTNEDKRIFYETCSKILEIDHIFKEPVHRRTRWNTRLLGNGRYPGFGLVQCFGHSTRVVTKDGTKMFKTYDEVYEYLRKIVDNAKESV
jgi:hypothetical protein